MPQDSLLQNFLPFEKKIFNQKNVTSQLQVIIFIFFRILSYRPYTETGSKFIAF